MTNQRTLSDSEDAFGHALIDCLEGKTVAELIERSDGFLDVASRDVRSYFARCTEWSEDQQAAAAEVRGRTLDVGCGAGRFLLHLQSQGHEVVGIDVSPLALEVCRHRGARDVRQMSVADVDSCVGERTGTTLPQWQGWVADAMYAPPYYPPVSEVLSGRDGTFWLGLNPPARDGREWLVLTSAGDPIGRVLMPPGLRVLLADEGNVWGVETDELDVQYIVRYAVVQP